MTKKMVSVACAIASFTMHGLVLASYNDQSGHSSHGQLSLAQPGSSPARSSGTESDSHWHSVQRGETLNSIARQHDLTFEQLADMNRILPPYLILTGQKLRTRSAAKSGGGAPLVPTSESRPVLYSASVMDKPITIASAPAVFKPVVAQLTSLQTNRPLRDVLNHRRGLFPPGANKRPWKVSERIKSGKKILKSSLGEDSPFRLKNTYVEKLPDWDEGEMFSRNTELNTDMQLRLHEGLKVTGQFRIPGERLSSPRLSQAGSSNLSSLGDTTDPFGSSETEQGNSVADLEKHFIQLNAGGELGNFGYGAKFLSWSDGYESLGKKKPTKRIREGEAGHESWVSWKQGDLGLKTGYSQYWDNVEKDPEKSRYTDRLFSISPSYTLYDWPYVGVSVAYEQGSRQSSMEPAGKQSYRGSLSKISTTFDVSAEKMNLYFGASSLRSNNDLVESQSSKEVSYYIGGSYYPFASLYITPSFDISELTELNGTYEYRYTTTNTSLSVSYDSPEHPYRVDLYAGYDTLKDSGGYTDAESINTSLSLDWDLKSHPKESSTLSFGISSYTYTDRIYSDSNFQDLAAEVVWRWTGY